MFAQLPQTKLVLDLGRNPRNITAVDINNRSDITEELHVSDSYDQSKLRFFSGMYIYYYQLNVDYLKSITIIQLFY